MISSITTECKWFANRPIWIIDKSITDNTTPGQNGHGTNGNHRVFYSPQSSRKGASPPDIV